MAATTTPSAIVIDKNIDLKDVKPEDIYNSIKESSQLIELSNDSLQQKELIDKINIFLEKYKTRKIPDEDPNTPWIHLSLKEIFRKTIQTAIDIINDISDAISNKELISNSEYRRSIFMAFTARDRRIYVGIWLIVFSFILYFIDSSA
uniref:Uncharacterized protein n=1 Tax=viral metagenome TaxID=1070528 RepID=A0A6C0KS30_9ZZZZ